jgi:MoxR-like ATPase
LTLGYPSREAERAVLRTGQIRRPKWPVALSPEEAVWLQQACETVSVSLEVENYLLDLIEKTRTDARFVRGASTRGSVALYRAVRAHALVKGRAWAVPEDVRDLCGPVLGHRVVARSGDGEAAIRALLLTLPSPV